MIRVARGTTEIEGFDLDDGRILFDATFTDAPGVGTHTYSLQMRTQDPNTLCTAYRGDGAVPLPSLLVQSFYAGSPKLASVFRVRSLPRGAIRRFPRGIPAALIAKSSVPASLFW